MRLHLGCGRKKIKGYLNCDISKNVNPDKIVDLTKKLPFKENSVDEILIEHVLEHIPNIFNLFKEFYRICKKDALIRIAVPYFSHESAFSTMTHVRFFTWTSFDFMDAKNPRNYDAVGNFKTIYKKLKWRKVFRPLELIFNLFPRTYQELFCWIFPAKELRIVLKVVK
jgi:ubiquinone/menaquinone biosynthesis C-methylase UbiE